MQQDKYYRDWHVKNAARPEEDSVGSVQVSRDLNRLQELIEERDALTRRYFEAMALSSAEVDELSRRVDAWLERK